MPNEPYNKEGDESREKNQSDTRKGPGKSEAGKKASSLNALKNGFHSTKILLPGESPEEFDTFVSEVLQQLMPRTAMEQHLLKQYIPLAWRLQRLPEIEAGIFVRYGISNKGNQCGPSFAMVATVQQDNILIQLSRYETTLRRGAFKYLELLRNLRKDESQNEEKPVIEAEIVRPESVRPVSGGLPQDESRIEEKPVIEPEAVEPKIVAPISPAPPAPVETDAPLANQPESVPPVGRAVMASEAGGTPHLALKEALRDTLKRLTKAQVETKLSEEKPHEQSNGSSDT